MTAPAERNGTVKSIEHIRLGPVRHVVPLDDAVPADDRYDQALSVIIMNPDLLGSTV